MAQATVLLREWDRRGNLTQDELICGRCLETHIANNALSRGERRVLTPWAADVRDCQWCEDTQYEGVIPGLKRVQGRWELELTAPQ